MPQIFHLQFEFSFFFVPAIEFRCRLCQKECEYLGQGQEVFGHPRVGSLSH